jgi:hypothetical protein|tara:strand:+ start:742 stop:912 length:171 start_codon:yes stop_codon:yes gene_type:complete
MDRAKIVAAHKGMPLNAYLTQLIELNLPIVKVELIEPDDEREMEFAMSMQDNEPPF